MKSLSLRYWVIAGSVFAAPHAFAAKRRASLSGQHGALSAMRARLATDDEIAAYQAGEPARAVARFAKRAEYEAKERLIAAAPELLAALCLIERKLNAVATTQFGDELAGIAHAAIAKAEGIAP